MESRASIFGHSIHQALIVFPLGLLSTAVIFDVLHFLTGDATWTGIAFYMIPAGIFGGLVAALVGVVDWTDIPAGTRAKAVATTHVLGNILVILLFGGSWLLRQHVPINPTIFAYIFSLAGLAVAVFTGWLGGELVDRMGVGVARGANLNAPSSLSGQPANKNLHSTAGD